MMMRNAVTLTGVMSTSLGLAMFQMCEASPSASPSGQTAAIAARMTRVYDRLEGLPPALLANKVEIRHRPAGVSDPVIMDREAAVAGYSAEIAALQRAMPDLHMSVRSTVVKGNSFTLNIQISGTRRNGTKFSSPVRMTYRISHGLIRAWEAAEDPNEHAALGEAATEGAAAAENNR